MASGTIRTLVKQGSISGTTDANSNVRIDTVTKKVVAIKMDDVTGVGHIMGVPFVFHNGYTYAKISTTQTGAAVASTNVTGTYWYID